MELKRIHYPYIESDLISALHKCLRAGDLARSCYFAKVIKENIGVWRVKQYMFYIVLEETLSLELYLKALTLFKKEDELITDIEVYELISKFCSCTKKWDSNDGKNFYINYIKTEIEYENDIVNEIKKFDDIKNPDRLIYWENKIKEYDKSFNQKTKTHKKTYTYGIPELFYYLEECINNNQFEDILYLSHYFFLNKEFIPFDLLEQFVINENKDIFKALNITDGKYGYYFNWFYLFYAMLKTFDRGNFKEPNKEFIRKIDERVNKALKEKRFIDIPLIAYDEHTGNGKRLYIKEDIHFYEPFNKYNTELKYTDLRFGGLFYGVIWKICSIEQYGKIMDKWEDVIITDDYQKLGAELFNAHLDYYDKKIEKIKYEDYKK